MDIEVITDDVPTGDRGISGDDGLDMGQEIFFGARGTTKGGDKLSRHDIATQDKATRTMTFILEFASLHMTWCQRESGMLAFERLHASQLVGTDGTFTLLSDNWGLLIHPTDRSDGRVFLWVLRWGQPVADQMRLEIPFFKRRVAWRGEMCSIMPRVITSSASSRPVQWLMGRSLGCSHARAIS